MYQANSVADWFLAYAEDDPTAEITHLKLQKILYYAQAHYMAVYNKPLFNDEIQAWQYGPVTPNVYNRFKNEKSTNLYANEDFDFDSFSDEDNQFLIEIWEHYGQFSANKLVDMTHQETPWIEYYYTPNRKGDKNNEVIPLDAIAEFFRVEENV